MDLFYDTLNFRLVILLFDSQPTIALPPDGLSFTRGYNQNRSDERKQMKRNPLNALMSIVVTLIVTGWLNQALGVPTYTDPYVGVTNTLNNDFTNLISEVSSNLIDEINSGKTNSPPYEPPTFPPDFPSGKPSYPNYTNNEPPPIIPSFDPDFGGIFDDWMQPDPPVVYGGHIPSGPGDPYYPPLNFMEIAASTNNSSGGSSDVGLGNSPDGFGLSVTNEATVSILYDPFMDHLSRPFAAFTVKGTNGSATTAYKASNTSIATWDVKVVSTNPLAIIVTNVFAQPAIGIQKHTISLWQQGLPKGVNVVGQNELLTLKLGWVTEGTTYILESKTNLLSQDWTIVSTTISSSANSTTNGIMSLNVYSGGASNLYFRIRSTNDVSNIIGYYTVSIAAGKKALVANQFSVMDPRIKKLFYKLPAGSRVEKSYGSTWTTNIWDGTNWTIPNDKLVAGEAALVSNPSGSTISVTFAGRVLQGGIGREILDHESILSYPYPRAGNPESFKLPVTEGDILYQYLPTSGTYTNYMYTSNSWWPTMPQLAVGEGFALNKASSNTFWNLSREWYPLVEGPFGPAITNYVYDDPINYNGLTLDRTTNYLVVHSIPNTTNDVLVAESIDGPWTVEATVVVGPLRKAVAAIAVNNRQTLFFRTVWPSGSYQSGQQMMMQQSYTLKSSQSESRKMARQQLIEIGTILDGKENGDPTVSKYSLTHPDAPPLPFNPFGLPEYLVGEKTFIDDRIVERVKKEVAVEEINRKQAVRGTALPSWLLGHQ